MAVVAGKLPKSRVSYMILGLFFGLFGAHNFYLGCWCRGICQMLITILSLGMLSPVVYAWVILDICLVRADVHGFPLAW